mmetsp:Transcript_40160/g.63757  ORF Transcript_40160/g.63757 Transcript_40160/m.63757 type:complete len:247 (-) Transcript_40160:76-816(-)
MITMITGIKRNSVYEEFRDHVKRYRLEEALAEQEAEDAAGLPRCPSWVPAEEVIAGVVAASRRCRGNIDDSPLEPAEKRLRLGCSPLGSDCSGASSSSREESVRRWAEAIVKTLQGCPSVEEAHQRAARFLTDVEAEVRQSTLSEVERDCPSPSRSDTEERPSQESTQALQHTNRVLMRAVHHLAKRCHRIEAGNEETPMLRQELEKSEEAIRRLQHSNEVLQHHLKLALNECHDRPLPWGNHTMH